jgi:predicted nucleotidyltransferase
MTSVDKLGDILPYLPKDKRIISVTEVGSGMWGMRELSSDHDIVVIYSDNMADFMAGRGYAPNMPCKHGIRVKCNGGCVQGEEYDFSYMEVGHLINLLKKGNINAIWATLSPIVITTSDLHKEISAYVGEHPTKAIIPSLDGMVMSQLSDAVKRAKVKDRKKNIMTAMRTVQFGLNLVRSKQYIFTPVTISCNEEDVKQSLANLKFIVKDSNICDKIPAVGLEEILLKHRMQFLKEDFERREK